MDTSVFSDRHGGPFRPGPRMKIRIASPARSFRRNEVRDTGLKSHWVGRLWRLGPHLDCGAELEQRASIHHLDETQTSLQGQPRTRSCRRLDGRGGLESPWQGCARKRVRAEIMAMRCA